MHQNVDGALAFVLRLVSGLPLGRDRQRLVVRLLLAALIPTGVSSPAAILTWTGGGANAYWINSVNWGSAGVPTNGDTLIFPAGQPAELNTNNIAGLVLNQICFAGMGSGYDLRGNPITLTNSIMATNAAGINIIENNLILATATNLLIVVSNGASLTLDGVLSGSVGVNKAGLGTLLYQCAGNNAYTGTTLVSGGTLQFNVSGPNAVSGPLVIGDGTGDGNPTVEDLQTYEMNNLPSVTINDNGLLNLNNFSEPNFSSNLVMNVGGISTGTGTLTLPANSTITLEYFGNGPAYINGNLSLGGGTLTLQAEGSVYLDLAANVSGSANIAQNSALVCWSGTNTFTGSFTANSSEVELDSSQALGNTNNTMTLNDQALIDIAGGVNLTNQSLTVNSGGILALSPRASSPSSSPNSWQTSFILGTDCTIGLDGNNLPFTLNGPISGPGGISMYGYGIGNGGTLTLSGATANTYAGATTVGCTSYSTNTLLLDKPSGITAIPGPLVVGSSNVVRLLNDYQIDNPATPVTLADASLLDLNGYTDEVGPITMQGAQITGASSGYLTFASNITVNVSTVAQSVISVNCVLYDGTYMITNTSHLFSPDLVISGNLESGIYVSPPFFRYASITLIKAGNGGVSLAGNNGFYGPVIVNGGNLWVPTSAALGATNSPVTVNSGGCLLLTGSGMDFGLKPLVLNGTGSFNTPGAVNSPADNINSWEGAVSLASNSLLYQNADSYLTLGGAISGSGGVTIEGLGTVIYAGTNANTYTGLTTVNGGQLDLDKSPYTPAIAPYGAGLLIEGGADEGSVAYLNSYQLYSVVTPVTINNNGELQAYADVIGPVAMSNGVITCFSGTLALPGTVTSAGTSVIWGSISPYNSTLVFSNTGSLSIHANIGASGSSGITQTGGGTLYMNYSNSYTGLTTVQQGVLWAQNSSALGATNSGVVVANGATLVLDGGVGITNKSLTLNGFGLFSYWGAFGVETGTNSWAGPILLNSNSEFYAWGSGSALRINGPITGPGGLGLFNESGGVYYFDGAAANTYAGVTTVEAGTTLLLNKTGFDEAIPTNLVINGTVRLLNVNQIANSADVTVNGSGLLDIAAAYEGIDTLSGTGSVSLSAGYLVLGYGNGSSTFKGIISGTNYLAKNGAGAITLTGANTYSGSTIINQGSLLVNGFQPQSAVTVAANATLGGSGTVGAIAADGIVSPGTGSGSAILNSSNVTFSSSGQFSVQLAGPTAGSGYDQLEITGTNTLANASLTVLPTFTSPVALGQQFTIIANNGAAGNHGTFSGLPEGATISSGNCRFTISYVGGPDNNNVVLTLTSIPNAVASAAVTAGDGSHGIDPNGCNNLALAITNTTGAAMADVVATLSTTTEGVIITQPYASYPNIPANGLATNVLPFQISTLPSFTCGTAINLQLIVNSSLGAFTMNYVLNSGETAAPTRYDNNTAANVPDVGTIFSTNTVAGWAGGPITKVTVSLWLGAPIDSDLSLWLISPNGTTVTLAAGDGGDNPNFGAGTADASRTTFDDAAATSITNGTAPFVGAFSPQSPLAAFIGTSPNGAWQLKIQDGGFAGSPDTLRVWSLFLDGTACSSGSGACDYCLTSAVGTVTNTGATQTDRISRTGTAASCGAPKAWPGVIGDAAARHYASYAFTNSLGSEACVTAVLNSAGDLEEAIYLNAFNPANIATNYLADAGNSTGGNTNNPMSCSASIPAGATFYVTINEITPGTGGGYTLQLSGLPCPPPTLAIQPVAPNQARISWNTSAGGYLLEGDSNLTLSAWAAVTNEPIVSGGRYNVTNSATTPANQFFRLYKP